MRYCFAFLFVLAFAPFLVSAHGVGGTLETVVEGYLVDIGYQPANPRAGIPVAYDFLLTDSATGRPAEFDFMWVRVSKGKNTVLATGIAKAEFGPTTLVYTYPEGGDDYEIAVRFEGAEATLAEATFSNLPVEGASAA
ncbi:MAG: hypothetical protein Q8P12_06845, partial [bacterium]|nr:hypothetical protein [bacterium]